MWGSSVFVVLWLSSVSNAAVTLWSPRSLSEKQPQNLQFSGPLLSQTSGPLTSQPSEPLAPQPSGPLPQLFGPLAAQPQNLPFSWPLPQPSGPLATQLSGLLLSQPSGPLASQFSGPLFQPSGPVAPQPSGPLASQFSGPFFQPSGPDAPQPSVPLASQFSGPLFQPSGPDAPQPSGSLFQPAGPDAPQPSGSLFQPAGPLSPQISQPLTPQLFGPSPLRSDPQLQVPTSGKCNMDDADKIPCGEPGLDASRCGAINCCFDGQQCYYGKTVTVQCTIDGQFILVVARDTTLPRISLDSISLLGGSDWPCGVVDYNADFAIYQFPVTACGTNAMVFGDYVIYENKMVSSYEVGVGPLGAITRDSHYELYFQCRYLATSVSALSVALSSNDPPLPIVASGPLRVELRLGNGQCVTKGCVEEQVAYTSYYTEYPVTKVLREPVYVEVRMLERTDPNLVLVLGHCWATSTPNPDSVPQCDLLVNGCPYEDDRYRTALVPVDGASGLPYPSHYKRFVFKMFTFVDPASMTPLKERVYIHCSTAVCSPTAGATCEPKCNRRRRDVGSVAWSSQDISVVSSGEVIYTQTDQLQHEWL